MSLRRGAVVQLKQREETEAQPLPTEVAASPLYGVAMLKIAMELKKADAAAGGSEAHDSESRRPQANTVDELITGVLKRMHLPEADFRAFLAMNGGLLKTIAQKRRY